MRAVNERKGMLVECWLNLGGGEAQIMHSLSRLGRRTPTQKWVDLATEVWNLARELGEATSYKGAVDAFILDMTTEVDV